MPYETIDEALKDASRDQLVSAARDKGYDPAKEDRVIKQRDKLFSDKARAEHEASELKAKYELVQKENSELKTKLDETTSKIENIGDLDAINQELEKYRATEAERKAKIEADYNAKIEALTESKSPIVELIPDYDEPERKLKWINDYETKIGGQKPNPVATPNDLPTSNGEIPDSVKRAAESQGISPQQYLKNKQIEDRIAKQKGDHN